MCAKLRTLPNHGLVFRENDVRVARKILRMKSKAKALLVKVRPHNHFRLCVLAVDMAHVSAALLFRQMIHDIFSSHQIHAVNCPVV